MRIAIVGGGISGLAAAHRMVELLPQAELTLFEATERLGGVLDTVHRDGCLVERSADSFLTKEPWAVDLCRRLGISDQLLPTDESRRRALVVRGGKLLRVPNGFVLMTPGRLWPLVTSPVLSWRGKLRLLGEPWVRPRVSDPGSVGSREPEDESVASFARRRLGREAFERLVQPLVAGVYTADPEKLSMAATLPELWSAERACGSLYRGRGHPRGGRPARSAAGDAPPAGESGARYGLFVAPREGLSQFVRAVASRLPEGSVRLNSTVTQLRPADAGGWQFELRHGETQSFDAVVVALPAYAAAGLFSDSAPKLAAELEQIEYASCAVVSLGYRREQMGRRLDGFGFVVPQIERRRIIAASFASEKFPGRAPGDAVVIRVFVGGALQPEQLDQPDDRLAALAHDELRELLHASGAPSWVDVARWPRSMPQYHVGHLGRVTRIEAAVDALPGIELAGNAYRGVGIPQCIHSGESAAERVANCLRERDADRRDYRADRNGGT